MTRQTTYYVQWLPHGQPVPKGCERVDTVGNSHHNEHAVLIRRRDLETQNDLAPRNLRRKREAT